MLRFLSERRVWVVAAFVAFALVLGVWSWGMPRISARAADVIAERLGVDTQIEKTSLFFGGVDLRGVELRGRHGGFVARIEHIEARMSLLGAVLNGARSVRALSARGLDVTLDLSHEGFRNSIAQLRKEERGSKSTPAPSGSNRKGRTYALEGVTLRVIDADGQLVSMSDVSLHKNGDDMLARFGDALLGEQSADHASIGPTKLELRRNEGAWKLRELEIRGASVRSLRNGNEESRALATRLRDALSQLRALPAGTGTGTGTGTENGTGTGTGPRPSAWLPLPPARACLRA